MDMPDLAVAQKDILRVVPVEGLVPAFADDLWGQHLNPPVTDMIFGFREACRIKLAHLFGASDMGTVRETRSGNPATQNPVITGIDVRGRRVNMAVERGNTSSDPTTRAAVQTGITTVREIKIFNPALWKTGVMFLSPPTNRSIMHGGRRGRGWHQRGRAPLSRQECKDLVESSLAGSVVLLDCQVAFQKRSLR